MIFSKKLGRSFDSRNQYQNAYAKDWRERNNDHARERDREQHFKHKERRNMESRLYYNKHAEERKSRQNLRNAERRIRILRYYSNNTMKCACARCGENIVQFLTVDHINGGGREHRNLIRSHGSAFYLALEKADYPEGYRVLCYNCNCGRRNGKCPHEIS